MMFVIRVFFVKKHGNDGCRGPYTSLAKLIYWFISVWTRMYRINA